MSDRIQHMANMAAVNAAIASGPGVPDIAKDMPKPDSYIGKTATLVVRNPDPRRDSGELRVPVAIFDAKSAYGRIDVLIRPLDGSGEMWVTLGTLEDIS